MFSIQNMSSYFPWITSIACISFLCLFSVNYVKKHCKTVKIYYKLLCKYWFPKMPYQVPNTHAFEYPLPPFPETWYPMCMYNELASGVIDTVRIAGRDLIVYLDNNHYIHVQDRYCPHMGIDLKYGTIQNQCIICPFHRHCIDPKKQNDTIGEKTKNIYVTEVVCNIVFVWIGPLTKNKPAYSMQALFKELYDSDDGSLRSSWSFPLTE